MFCVGLGWRSGRQWRQSLSIYTCRERDNACVHQNIYALIMSSCAVVCNCSDQVNSVYHYTISIKLSPLRVRPKHPANLLWDICSSSSHISPKQTPPLFTLFVWDVEWLWQGALLHWELKEPAPQKKKNILSPDLTEMFADAWLHCFLFHVSL